MAMPDPERVKTLPHQTLGTGDGRPTMDLRDGPVKIVMAGQLAKPKLSPQGPLLKVRGVDGAKPHPTPRAPQGWSDVRVCIVCVFLFPAIGT